MSHGKSDKSKVTSQEGQAKSDSSRVTSQEQQVKSEMSREASQERHFKSEKYWPVNNCLFKLATWHWVS